MRYSVTLERGSDATYLAWVHELPGCFARAETRADVIAKLPEAIRAFLAWSGADADEPVDVVVAEEIESRVPAADDTEALLEPDRKPLSRPDWEQIERLLRQSRRELRRLLGSIGDDDLRWQPPGRPRTIADEIQHVAYVELMYALWTFDLGSRSGLDEFLRWTRTAAAARMRALARADRGAVTHADWSGAADREQWTARKAARRLIWHERVHIERLERALAQRDGSAPGETRPPTILI